MQKAFVTGGTGFIGLNLVKLLTEKGWEVSALHRSSSDLTYLKRFPVELKEGSITDKRTLMQILPEDTDVVFHLAGDTNMWSKKNQRQRNVNVFGTQNMVDASIRKGVKTFIHTSSVAAWGHISGDITEETPQHGDKSWINYDRTKWASEREALKAIKAGIKVVIMNPAMVTGPYDTNNWGSLFTALHDGSLPGIPDGEVNLNHVREVVKAHEAAVNYGNNGERYILGGYKTTFEDFIKTIAQTAGIKNIPRILPSYLFKIMGRLSSWKGYITGESPDITPELAGIMTQKDVRFICEKAKSQLNYKIISIEESVQDCYSWLKAEQHL